ncbi:hypothetical protein [Corynebacterium cystitidis]|uniref:hypothetical protein n=1 Tax=Corynebacterium cystitidis TaxID=35757 RepID=UPI00211DE328|nr:hypothetical protein [Corynebacterium cystitidis]
MTRRKPTRTQRLAKAVAGIVVTLGLTTPLSGCNPDQPTPSSASARSTVTVTETSPGPTQTLDHTVTETNTITKYVHAETTVDTPGPLPGAENTLDPNAPPPEGFVWEEVGPHGNERTCTGYQRASTDETAPCFKKEDGWYFHALRPEP